MSWPEGNTAISMSKRKGGRLLITLSPAKYPGACGWQGPSSYPSPSAYSNIPTHREGRYHKDSQASQKVPEFCAEAGKNANSRALPSETDSMDLGRSRGICILKDISINLFSLGQVKSDAGDRNNLTSSFNSNTCVNMSFRSII